MSTQKTFKTHHYSVQACYNLRMLSHKLTPQKVNFGKHEFDFYPFRDYYNNIKIA